LTGAAGQRHRENEWTSGGILTRNQQSNKDLIAQRKGLHALGVGDDRIYVDYGPTGTNRDARLPPLPLTPDHPDRQSTADHRGDSDAGAKLWFER
jgi:hypothetical protein